MVDDGGRRSLDELRLSIDHLRAAARLLACSGWRDVSSLWRSGARVALDARRRIEQLLAGFSRPRDPQLRLIDLPDSIASRLESAWHKARADLEARWGAHGISAGNGQEAMDRLREAGADVVLCDLRMPQVDGFEFIRRLRADPKCHGLPAIAVSGVGSGGSRLRARELGFDAYLSKPPEFDALGLFVRRAMESRRSSSH